MARAHEALWALPSTPLTSVRSRHPQEKKPICWYFSLMAARRPLLMRLTARRPAGNRERGRAEVSAGRPSGRPALLVLPLVAADRLVRGLGVVAAAQQDAPGAVAFLVVLGRCDALL